VRRRKVFLAPGEQFNRSVHLAFLPNWASCRLERAEKGYELDPFLAELSTSGRALAGARTNVVLLRLMLTMRFWRMAQVPDVPLMNT